MNITKNNGGYEEVETDGDKGYAPQCYPTFQHWMVCSRCYFGYSGGLHRLYHHIRTLPASLFTFGFKMEYTLIYGHYTQK